MNATSLGPVHICLISDAALPNINPALPHIENSRFFPPRRAIFLCGREHLEQARYQKQVFVGHEIQTDILTIEQGLDPMDIFSLVGQVTAVFETLSVEEKNCVVLNVTDGGKALSLAALSVFMRNNLPAFLVDEANERLVWLNGEDKRVFNIPDSANLENVLAGRGYKIISPNPVRYELQSKLLHLAEQMAKNVTGFSHVIGAFNGYMRRAKESKGKFKAEPISPELLRNDDFIRMVGYFCDTGLLHWETQDQGDSQHLVFHGQEAACFLRGGWFELYLYVVIEKLRCDWAAQDYPVKIGDIACGINIEAPTGSRNGIDVAFLCNNHLYLIECKTGYFDPEHHPSGPASTMLYKLDWLRDLGVNACKRAIFSYRVIPEQDLDRARKMNIDVIAGGEDIVNLRRFLEKWIEVPQTD